MFDKKFLVFICSVKFAFCLFSIVLRNLGFLLTRLCPVAPVELLVPAPRIVCLSNCLFVCFSHCRILLVRRRFYNACFMYYFNCQLPFQ